LDHVIRRSLLAWQQVRGGTSIFVPFHTLEAKVGACLRRPSSKRRAAGGAGARYHAVLDEGEQALVEALSTPVPNPSIERTVAGKPATAAHVER
jgi:hypothetical protein